jgi:hypothetical protein
MALSDIVFEFVNIRAGNQSFPVQGLSLSDLTTLLTEHRADFMVAIALFEEHKDNPTEFAVQVTQVLPRLVAAAVALAAGEPTMTKVVERLPAPVVLDAVMAVGRLTFTDPLALPNFLANLTGLLGGVGNLAKSATH